MHVVAPQGLANFRADHGEKGGLAVAVLGRCHRRCRPIRVQRLYSEDMIVTIISPGGALILVLSELEAGDYGARNLGWRQLALLLLYIEVGALKVQPSVAE